MDSVPSVSAPSSSASIPELSLSLSTSSEVLDINGWPDFTLEVTVISHACRPITVLTRNTILDPGGALWQDRFEFVDTESDTKVNRERLALCNHGPIRRTWKSEKLFLTLHPGVPHVVTRTLSTPGSDLSLPQDETDINGLELGHTYVVRATQGHPVTWWDYGTKEELLDPPGKSIALTGRRPPLLMDDVQPCKFLVGEVFGKHSQQDESINVTPANGRAPPSNLNLNISLTASSSTLHLSGSPPFELIISITSNEPYPITLERNDSLLQPSKALMQDRFSFIDMATHQKVEREYISIRMRGMERAFLHHHRFMTLEPGVLKAVKATFTTRSDRFDHTNGLESGKKYVLTVKDEQSTLWWKGTIDEVTNAAGPGACIGASGSVELVCSDQITFEVI